MTQAKILVTSATGRTGLAAAKALLAKGFPVRAFVRRRSSQAQALEAAGAELFIGDIYDYRDVLKALDGVQRAFYCPPFGPNLLHGATVFALAAEEAKLEVIALLSQWLPNPTDPSIVTREHWLANNIYRWMPSVDVIHVNPGLFAVMYLLGLPAVIHFGMLMAPYGDGLNAPPSNEDIGRVGAGVLMNPAEHIGKSYRPTGPKLISPADMAVTLSKILERKVTYRDVPYKMFLKAGMAMGFSFTELSQLRFYADALRGGAFEVGAPTDHVQQITGQPAEDFETIARRYIADPKLIHPALNIGSKLDAFGFLIRMLATRPADLDAYERSQGYPILRNPADAANNPAWRVAAEQKQLYLNK